MRIALISFTKKGAALNRGLASALGQAVGYHLSAYEESDLIKVSSSLKEWTKTVFEQYEAVIYIGATGIAVRAIAPFLISKDTDPAILSVDELGQNVIALVSGHIGGANKLARAVAVLTNGQAIISTATDLEGCFAVDEWAKEQGFILNDLKKAKLISATLLQGLKVGIKSDYPIVGALPQGIEQGENYKRGLYIGYDYTKSPYEQTLWLIPKQISLGIGCKKGTSFEKIERLVRVEFEKMGLPLEAIKNIASIDLKKEEEGLLKWAKHYDKPIYFYDSKVLEQVKGDFTPSAFVRQITGVENVCERSAVKASKQGLLILKKTALEGVTIALAIADYQVVFNENV